MASVKLTFTTTSLPEAHDHHEQIYGAWRLLCSVTDANDTDGNGTNDPNIFVIRTDKTVDAANNREVFSHVASLYEMNNLPVSISDVKLLPPKMPPKVTGHYRSSLLKLDFMNTRDLEKAKVDIQRDVDLLMRASSNDAVSEEVIVTAETLAGDALTVRWGVSSQAFNSLTPATIESFEYAVLEDGVVGHAGELSPGGTENEYIYVMYPEELPECDTFKLGGFTTTEWPSSSITWLDTAVTPNIQRSFRVYRTNQKLGTYPETISYDIHKA